MSHTLVFLCEESGYPAFEYLKENGYNPPKGVTIIKVPCSGRIDIEFLSEAVKNGVKRICVFGCFDGNCRYNWGNRKAMYRIGRLKALLKGAGVEDVSIEFIPVASTSYAKLRKELERRLGS